MCVMEEKLILVFAFEDIFCKIILMVFVNVAFRHKFRKILIGPSTASYLSDMGTLSPSKQNLTFFLFSPLFFRREKGIELIYA